MLLAFYAFSQWLHAQEIHPLSLLFRGKKWESEKLYICEHDPLYKFYIAASFLVLLSMGIILLLTEQA